VVSQVLGASIVNSILKKEGKSPRKDSRTETGGDGSGKERLDFFGHAYLTKRRAVLYAVKLDALRHKQPFEACHQVISVYIQATQYIYQREPVFRPGVYRHVRFPKKHISRNALWAKLMHAFLHDMQLANFCRKPEALTYFALVVKRV